MSDDRPKDKNQGEGDRESARRYNEHAREFVVYEKRGKAPAHMTRLEQLRGVAQRVRHAIVDFLFPTSTGARP